MNILVVDDDRSTRIRIKSLLIQDGHHVQTAENGKVGVDTFSKNIFDLVFMDVIMPEMNGRKATTQIKKLAGTRFVPVVFLSALSDDTDLIKCINAGGDDFLHKNSTLEVIRSKIKAMIRIKELHEMTESQNRELVYHQTLLKQEMDIGNRVFKNIIKSGDIQGKKCLKYFTSPATTFNGDIILASHSPDSSIRILLGDFTGHGLSAAVSAMPVSQLFYNMSLYGFSINDIAVAINNKLVEILPPIHVFDGVYS